MRAAGAAGLSAAAVKPQDINSQAPAFVLHETNARLVLSLSRLQSFDLARLR
jgi:hypothetical protein